MQQNLTRREFLRILALGSAGLAVSACAPQVAPTTQASPYAATQSNAAKSSTSSSSTAAKAKTQSTPAPANNSDFFATEILGRPTNTLVTVNVVPAKNMDIYYEYGTASGNYTNQTPTTSAKVNTPLESLIDKLTPNTRYYYRLRYRQTGTSDFAAGAEHTFITQRAPGSTFTFDIQGDSHPERLGKQFDPDLYKQTLQRAASDQPDFFMTIGDDFSVDTLKDINANTVTERYTLQRPFLGLVGSSAPIFLVNGNHEQAAQYNLNGTPNNVAVWAQNARNRYYPQPAPDNFYTGDAQ